MNLLLPLLRTLADRLPVAALTGPSDDPHLCRYQLCKIGPKRAPVRLYLQRILRSDDPNVTHNHPWAWAISLILVGGYREERLSDWFDEEGHSTAILRPGSINLLGAHTFHRIDLLEQECWSLFLAGPVTQSWSFWSLHTGTLIPWRKYFRRQGMAANWQPVPVGRMS